MHMSALFPLRFKASPNPIVVVVLPSPGGVGLIAVTRINLPSSLLLNELIYSSESFAL